MDKIFSDDFYKGVSAFVDSLDFDFDKIFNKDFLKKTAPYFSYEDKKYENGKLVKQEKEVYENGKQTVGVMDGISYMDPRENVEPEDKCSCGNCCCGKSECNKTCEATIPSDMMDKCKELVIELDKKNKKLDSIEKEYIAKLKVLEKKVDDVVALNEKLSDENKNLTIENEHIMKLYNEAVNQIGILREKMDAIKKMF